MVATASDFRLISGAISSGPDSFNQTFTYLGTGGSTSGVVQRPVIGKNSILKFDGLSTSW